MIAGIESREVDKWWSRVDGYITQALSYGLGEYSSEDIKELCKNQQAQLWLFGDEKELQGAIVTQIHKYPQFPVLLVLLLGGKNLDKHIEEIVDVLSRFSKDKDCKHMEVFGRKGWGNYLKDFKVKEIARIFSKEIV